MRTLANDFTYNLTAYMKKIASLIALSSLFVISGCEMTAKMNLTATSSYKMDSAQKAAKEEVIFKGLKRKLVLGRFSNESSYGKALYSGTSDPLERSLHDTILTQLIDSGKFVVLERNDIAILEKEQSISNVKANIIGSDTVLLGSITRFSRSVEGQTGFLKNTKRQVARAKITLRLVDLKTGYAFFSANGEGEAFNEASDFAGFGEKKQYDSTINDQAIEYAIGDALTDIMNKLDEKAWRADVLNVDGSMVFTSGGKRQGVKVGDMLVLNKKAGKVVNSQTGFTIDLPPKKIGTLKVTALFGDSLVNEGSVCVLVDGKAQDFLGADMKDLVVTEYQEYKDFNSFS